MNTISKGFAVMVLASLGAGMAGASTLTYTFTGTVTNAQGGFATFNGQSVLGYAVTGTYTFNYGAAIPSQSSGTPGSSSWSSTSGFPGNFPPGASLADNLVFTSTAQVVGTNISYATFPPGAGYNIGSNATGYNNGGSEFAASEQANQAPAGDTQSSVGISGNLPGEVFDANGGPAFPSSPFVSGNGDFAVANSGPGGVGAFDNIINYNITSISPPSTVPLPASAWLMLSGVGALGALARRRKI
jgi:hypothetical protein